MWWDSVGGMNEVRLAIMKVEKQGYDDSLYSFFSTFVYV